MRAEYLAVKVVSESCVKRKSVAVQGEHIHLVGKLTLFVGATSQQMHRSVKVLWCYVCSAVLSSY